MLLSVRDLRVSYRTHGHPPVEAVRGVSFTVNTGETLGIVGESGCGKSSLARALIGLQPLSGGSLMFEGVEPARMQAAARARYRRAVQMVFQDASGSLNPRMTVRQTLAEVLRVHHMATAPQLPGRLTALLDRVGLPAKVLEAYPRELSGGQCQRVSIARCLALEPRLLVADEPVSALDVSVQARILNLLRTLRDELRLAILLISHDLAVVRNVCDRVAVMYAGEFVEFGHADEVFARPRHTYTRTLLDAVPDVGRALCATRLADKTP